MELVFFIFVELFLACTVSELESPMASETEAAAGNTTINPEAASTAVETPVVVMAAAVDAAVAPDAGNSGSGGGVDVGSGEGETAVTIATATVTVTAAMTTTAAETVTMSTTTKTAAAAAAATTEAGTDSNRQR